MTSTTTTLPSSKNAFSTIAIAGILAGTLDGLAAIILAYFRSGVKPELIFKYIASGYFGPEAFKGGTEMVVWGVFFHYLIATSWAIFIYLIYPKVIGLLKNKYVVGIIAGIVVWFVMNLIVVPSSKVPPAKSFDITQVLINMAILIIAVGIPISMVIDARRSPK